MAPDDDACLISDGHRAGSLGRWHVHVRYGERRYDLGTYRLYPDAHRICSASNLEKALGSPEKRAKREVADGVL